MRADRNVELNLVAIFMAFACTSFLQGCQDGTREATLTTARTTTRTTTTSNTIITNPTSTLTTTNATNTTTTTTTTSTTNASTTTNETFKSATTTIVTNGTTTNATLTTATFATTNASTITTTTTTSTTSTTNTSTTTNTTSNSTTITIAINVTTSNATSRPTTIGTNVTTTTNATSRTTAVMTPGEFGRANIANSHNILVTSLLCTILVHDHVVVLVAKCVQESFSSYECQEKMRRYSHYIGLYVIVALFSYALLLLPLNVKNLMCGLLLVLAKLLSGILHVVAFLCKRHQCREHCRTLLIASGATCIWILLFFALSHAVSRESASSMSGDWVISEMAYLALLWHALSCELIGHGCSIVAVFAVPSFIRLRWGSSRQPMGNDARSVDRSSPGKDQAVGMTIDNGACGGLARVTFHAANNHAGSGLYTDASRMETQPSADCSTALDIADSHGYPAVTLPTPSVDFAETQPTAPCVDFADSRRYDETYAQHQPNTLGPKVALGRPSTSFAKKTSRAPSSSQMCSAAPHDAIFGTADNESSAKREEGTRPGQHRRGLRPCSNLCSPMFEFLISVVDFRASAGMIRDRALSTENTSRQEFMCDQAMSTENTSQQESMRDRGLSTESTSRHEMIRDRALSTENTSQQEIIYDRALSTENTSQQSRDGSWV